MSRRVISYRGWRISRGKNFENRGTFHISVDDGGGNWHGYGTEKSLAAAKKYIDSWLPSKKRIIKNPSLSTRGRAVAILAQVRSKGGWRTVGRGLFRTRRQLEHYLRALSAVHRAPARAIRPTIVKKNALKSNPAAPARDHAAELDAAAALQESFNGHPPRLVRNLTIPKPPRIVARIGLLRAVIYDAVRGGRSETYIHKFRKQARPTFAVSHDGRQLFMIGGSYNFTDRGIVDTDTRGER